MSRFSDIIVSASIRHGLYTTSAPDGGLSDSGRKHVENVAQQLDQFFPQELLVDTVFLSGSKMRVLQTAEIVESYLGIAAVTLPILNVEGIRSAPREQVLNEIKPYLAGKRAVLVAGQDHMIDWLIGMLHRSGNGYAALDYAEAAVITKDGTLHKLK